MINFKDAICPNCKANIKLNDQIEKTICQYCGYLIIIDEVLGKKPVTTPVERKRSDELEEARKYRDKKKFDKAEIILKELANKDDSDIEVFCELIKNEIDRLKELNFNEESSRVVSPHEWTIVEKIHTYFDKVKKIDKDNKAKDFLGEYYEKVEHYEEILRLLINDEKRLKNVFKKIDNLNYNFSLVCSVFEKYFTVSRTINYNGWKYILLKFTEITREGIIAGRYEVDTNIFDSSSEYNVYENLHPTKTIHNFSSIDEIEIAVDKALKDLENKFREEELLSQNYLKRERIKGIFNRILIFFLLWVFLKFQYLITYSVKYHSFLNICGLIIFVIMIISFVMLFKRTKIKKNNL